MNVRLNISRNYDKKSDWTFGENKPNSNPNKPNLLAVSKILKMNITSATTVNYINELRTTNYELIMKNKPNSNPNKPNLLAVSKILKMNITSATTKDYDKEQRTTNYELIMKNKPNLETTPLGTCYG